MRFLAFFSFLLFISTAFLAAADEDTLLKKLHQRSALNSLGEKVLKQAAQQHLTPKDKVHSLLVGKAEKYRPTTYPERIVTLNGNNTQRNVLGGWPAWLARIDLAPTVMHDEYKKKLLKRLTGSAETSEAEKPQEKKKKNPLQAKGLTYVGAGIAGLSALRLLYCALNSKRKRAASWLGIKKLFSPEIQAKIKAMPSSDQRTITMAQRRLIWNLIGIGFGSGMIVAGRYV